MSEAAYPSTVAFIGYHAAQRPGDVAVIEDGREVTYADFYRDIGRMVAALRPLGLGPGHVAGIECPQFYRHWLCVLAFEALGAASFSYDPAEAAPMAAALAGADCILCSPGAEPQQARRAVAMDAGWLAALDATQPESPVPALPIHRETPMRVVQNSGTTGTLKRMVHTARVREHWIRQYQLRAGFNRRARYLLAMRFTVEVFHVYATACIRSGGVCICDDRVSLAAALDTLAVSHVALPPFLLEQVLDDPARPAMKPDRLMILTAGAPVSVPIRERVRRELADDLMESYGSQEATVIATMDADRTGTILPGVRVEVVDDDGNPVFGAPGRVRVRSDGCVTGYLDDPEATARMFRDGWFYPGDLAVMQDSRRLRLIGRADDVLNIQGIKFAPGPLEEALRRSLPVTDMCVTAIPDGAGISRLWIVVVLPDPEQLPAIHEAVVARLPAAYGIVYFIAVGRIPRTVTGKVRRKELNDALLKARVNAPSP